MWPRKCPVCREELPERGNRRVRVPGRSGWALVHAGECFDLVDAQGVLEFVPSAAGLSALEAVRARARVEALLQRYEPVKHTREQLAVIACARVARLQQQFVGDESTEQFKRLHQHALKLVQRVLVHDGEVSGPGRTVVA